MHPRNLKGGSGSLFYPCVIMLLMWSGGHFAVTNGVELLAYTSGLDRARRNFYFPESWVNFPQFGMCLCAKKTKFPTEHQHILGWSFPISFFQPWDLVQSLGIICKHKERTHNTTTLILFLLSKLQLYNLNACLKLLGHILVQLCSSHV